MCFGINQNERRNGVDTFLPVVQVAVVVVLVDVVQGVAVKRPGLVVRAQSDDVILGDVTLGFDGDDRATFWTGFDR